MIYGDVVIWWFFSAYDIQKYIVIQCISEIFMMSITLSPTYHAPWVMSINMATMHKSKTSLSYSTAWGELRRQWSASEPRIWEGWGASCKHPTRCGKNRIDRSFRKTSGFSHLCKRKNPRVWMVGFSSNLAKKRSLFWSVQHGEINHDGSLPKVGVGEFVQVLEINTKQTTEVTEVHMLLICG